MTHDDVYGWALTDAEGALATSLDYELLDDLAAGLYLDVVTAIVPARSAAQWEAWTEAAQLRDNVKCSNALERQLNRAALAYAVPFEIDLTEADIARGKAGECAFCPIALAAQRTFGPHIQVHVSEFQLRVTRLSTPIAELEKRDTPDRKVWHLPPDAVNFVFAFDGEFPEDAPEREAVRPMRFRLLATEDEALAMDADVLGEPTH